MRGDARATCLELGTVAREEHLLVAAEATREQMRMQRLQRTWEAHPGLGERRVEPFEVVERKVTRYIDPRLDRQGICLELVEHREDNVVVGLDRAIAQSGERGTVARDEFEAVVTAREQHGVAGRALAQPLQPALL